MMAGQKGSSTMRKIKKINGYLVVRFNDRERREYETLGSYGVIDAELYTGHLAVDRSALEYDDADTLEAAIEQARGLESELDAEEPEVKVTIIRETDEATEEEEVDGAQMAAGWENILREQAASPRYPNIDARTAAHELHGYKAALRDLGILEGEDCSVPADTFGPPPRTSSEGQEELLSYVCDKLCQHRRPEMTEDQLERVCAKCDLERLANRATGTEKGGGTPVPQKAKGSGVKGFQNVRDGIGRSPRARAIYSLGLALAEKCPDNDCRVYLNIFNMARELDETIPKTGTYPAMVLRRTLMEHIRELNEMYEGNHAVCKYRGAAAPEPFERDRIEGVEM